MNPADEDGSGLPMYRMAAIGYLASSVHRHGLQQQVFSADKSNQDDPLFMVLDTQHLERRAVVHRDLRSKVVGRSRVSQLRDWRQHQHRAVVQALVCGCINVTKSILGPSVGLRPRLTSKLLKRPPFRYLRDIVVAVSRSTGFASELVQGDAPTEVPARLIFLEDLMGLVKSALGPNFKVFSSLSSKNILAGLDPESTNIFLQVNFSLIDVSSCFTVV